MIESWCFASGILLPRKIRELGHRFILATDDPDFYNRYSPDGGLHPVVALADRVLRCDTRDEASFLSLCEGLFRDEAISGVISSCDYYLPLVAAVAERFRLPSSPAKVLASMTDKHLMRQALRRKGLPGPSSFLALSEEDAEAAAGATGLPAIVKPRDMSGSTLVRKVHSVDQMRRAIGAVLSHPANPRGRKRAEGALVESYLSGEEFSVECCARRGDVFLSGITDKRLGGEGGFVERGHMFPADLPAESARAIGVHAAEALSAMGYVEGTAHVEIRMTPSGPRVIEMNPRIGGNYISELVERVTGLSPLTQMVEVALGEEPREAVEAERPKSAAVAFLLPSSEGTLVGFRGEAEAKASPGVVRCSLAAPGTEALRPDDNDCYLGHVLAEDREGPGAGRMAEEALSRLTALIRPRSCGCGGAAERSSCSPSP